MRRSRKPQELPDTGVNSSGAGLQPGTTGAPDPAQTRAWLGFDGSLNGDVKAA